MLDVLIGKRSLIGYAKIEHHSNLKLPRIKGGVLSARLMVDDIDLDGMDLIHDIRQIYDNYLFDTEILAASIRTANHVKDSALAGADVALQEPQHAVAGGHVAEDVRDDIAD